MVQFYPWFNSYFPLFLTHYHTLPYTKTKEIKIEPQHTHVLSVGICLSSGVRYFRGLLQSGGGGYSYSRQLLEKTLS